MSEKKWGGLEVLRIENLRVEVAGKYLGHIPKDKAKELAPQMDAGKNLFALFVSRNEHPFHDTVGLTVKIVEYSYQAAA